MFKAANFIDYYNDYRIKTFLNLTDSATHWKAVGFRDVGRSWDALDENQKYIKMTFQKNHSGKLYTKNSNGEIIEDDFSYSPEFMQIYIERISEFPVFSVNPIRTDETDTIYANYFGNVILVKE